MATPYKLRSRAGLATVLIVAVWSAANAQQPQVTPAADPNAGDSAGEIAALDQVEIVQFQGAPLFEVRAQLGRLTPSDRAAAISQRLEQVVKAGVGVLEKIHTEERSRSTEILAGNIYVMSVTDADSLPTGRTRQQLAADYSVALRQTLTRAFNGRSVRGVIIGVLVTITATVVLALLIYYANRYARPLRDSVRQFAVRHIHAATFRGTELLPAASIANALVRVSKFLQLLVMLLAGLLYLEVVLSAFQATSAMAGRLMRTLVDAFTLVAGGLFGYLPNVFYIAVILFVTHYLLRFARIFFVALAHEKLTIQGFFPEWAMPSYKILRFLAYAFAAVVVFPYLPGSGSPAFQGVSIFIGVLFSLGSTSAIANMVAGIVLTYMRPFRNGDRVKIADTIGDVIGKNLLVVRVRTIKNVEITIPNAMVLNNHIINFSSCANEPGLILHTTVTIGYDAPWRQVHELLMAAARGTEGLLAEPAPFVLQTALDDFYVSYELNAFTDEPNRMATIYSELHQNIQDEFYKAGVEIMSPHYAAVRDGNAMAVPNEYLPKDYKAPGFTILSRILRPGQGT